MTLLQLHVLDDWPDLLQRARGNARPVLPADGLISRDIKRRLIEYTLALGPLETADTRRIDSYVREVLESNANAVNGGRRVLLIDGTSAIGKTQGIGSHILKETDRVWQRLGRHRDGADVIPYVYVEATSGGQGRALLHSILRFTGLPVAANESADESLARLRALGPRLGIQAVVVDDAHMLRTVSADSRRLTDFLKTTITSLPFTFVFVGAGLEESALLRQATRGGYSAAVQISRRATVLQLKPWSVDDVGWSRLLASLEQRLVIPGGFRKGTLTGTKSSRLLHARATGHPGIAIDWVKRAAIAAIRSDSALTSELIAGHQPPRSTVAS
ncbi:P-loop NTPase family protein [Jatrophihabitans fulvus]